MQWVNLPHLVFPIFDYMAVFEVIAPVCRGKGQIAGGKLVDSSCFCDSDEEHMFAAAHHSSYSARGSAPVCHLQTIDLH